MRSIDISIQRGESFGLLDSNGAGKSTLIKILIGTLIADGGTARVLGILASNFACNEGQVFPFIPLVIMPSAFFSGMILSIDLLPDWVAPLSYITPMFYANEVIQHMIGVGVNAPYSLD